MNVKIVGLVALGTLIGLIAFSMLRASLDHAAALGRQVRIEEENKRIERRALELRPQIVEDCMDQRIGRYTSSVEADRIRWECNQEAQEQAIARAREALR